MNLTDRAKANEFNCIHGAKQLMYSLAQYGLLKDPFAQWASGFAPTEGKELDQYNKAILDLGESIIMFNDEIKENGSIMGND